MKHGKSAINFICFMLLSLFLVLSMFLVTLGVGVYRGEREKSTHTDESRVVLGYIANKLRAGDSEGLVSVQDREGVTALVLTEKDGVTETLIYFYDNAVCEQYKFIDSPVQPEFGVKLVGCSRFDFTLSDAGVFTCEVDYASGETESMTLKLLSGKEAA